MAVYTEHLSQKDIEFGSNKKANETIISVLHNMCVLEKISEAIEASNRNMPANNLNKTA